MAEFHPRPYQDLIMRHMIKTPRGAIWAGMGMGKTASTLFALDVFKRAGLDVFPVLILAPLRVAASTWPDEAEKWENLDIRVQPIIGSPEKRRQALRTPADAYATNYEQIPWLTETLGEDWPFRMIVADESTRLKGFRLGGGGGVRARALSRVAFKYVDRFIELSGTPAPNGFEDLWGQFWFIDRGERLCRSFGAFHDRFFIPERVAADPQAVVWRPAPDAQDEIQRAVADVTVSLKAEDYFGIEKPIENVIEVGLPPKAKKVYADLQREMYSELENGEAIEAVNAAALTVKCLQLASGAVYDDEEGKHYTVFHDEKIRALESVIEEAAGMPVLVAYHWKHDLERLQKAFPQGRALGRDPQIIRDWNAGRIPVLFAHPASAGHGLNLQDGGNILVFFSHWWDLEQAQQIVERIGPTRQAQAGHKRPVFIHYIVARGTVDELVLARRKSKASVQETLLAALKREKP